MKRCNSNVGLSFPCGQDHTTHENCAHSSQHDHVEPADYTAGVDNTISKSLPLDSSHQLLGLRLVSEKRKEKKKTNKTEAACQLGSREGVGGPVGCDASSLCMAFKLSYNLLLKSRRCTHDTSTRASVASE